MKARTKRFLLIAAGMSCLGVGVTLALRAFDDNLVFFFSPSQVISSDAPRSRVFRLGGLVESGSLRRADDGMTVRFTITDTAHSIPVVYKGILPDLFREGKGVVVQGHLRQGGHLFVADEVLAKHDENYMPPEAAQAIRQARRPDPDDAGPAAVNDAIAQADTGARGNGGRP